MKSRSATKLAFALVLPALFAFTAKADTLTGTTVTGSMAADKFDVVSTQFTSPAVVGSGVEFSGVFTDQSFGSNSYNVTADFTDGGLTVTIDGPHDIGAPYPLIALTFTDPAFVTPFTLASSQNASPNSLSLVGSTLTLDFDGVNANQVYTYSDVPASAATPEPSAIALLGTGLLGMGGLIRRRRSA